MELLFNLLWVALSAGLLALWLASQHRWADHALRPGTRMQIAALAVLILILFPVISLTDDLQACTAPAEVEQLVRRDLHDHLDNNIPAALAAAAELVSFQNAPGLQTILRPSPPTEIGTPREEFLSIVGNRPPPRA